MSATARPTPGEWNLGGVTVIDTATGEMVADSENGYVTIGDDDDGNSACEVHVEGENAAANARLIAAAPNLLAAAKRALATLRAQGESVRPGNVLGALEAAIKKATGEQP